MLKLAVFFAAVFPICASGPGTKSFVVEPHAAGGEQLLYLHGLKLPPSVRGVRVYLNPSRADKLTEESKSYVGSVFAPERGKGSGSTGNFVLTLPASVKGKTRVVVQPIASGQGILPEPIDLEGVDIRPAKEK
jgi:hypothetical protein